jgi:hypothetical protein
MKEAQKILKYKDLTTAIPSMWKVRANAIPVITEVTGTISKSPRQHPSNKPGKY